MVRSCVLTTILCLQQSKGMTAGGGKKIKHTKYGDTSILVVGYCSGIYIYILKMSYQGAKAKGTALLFIQISVRWLVIKQLILQDKKKNLATDPAHPRKAAIKWSDASSSKIQSNWATRLHPHLALLCKSLLRSFALSILYFPSIHQLSHCLSYFSLRQFFPWSSLPPGSGTLAQGSSLPLRPAAWDRWKSW